MPPGISKTVSRPGGVTYDNFRDALAHMSRMCALRNPDVLFDKILMGRSAWQSLRMTVPSQVSIDWLAEKVVWPYVPYGGSRPQLVCDSAIVGSELYFSSEGQQIGVARFYEHAYRITCTVADKFPRSFFDNDSSIISFPVTEDKAPSVFAEMAAERRKKADWDF